MFLPECASTNTSAQDLISKNKATEGCVVLAAAQSNGRGQRGNSWESEPDKNITLSVILSPGFLPASQQFYLNIAVSLAVLDLLQAHVPGPVFIKWPNDLYVQDKKIGGILIENSVAGYFLQHAIVGIGLNINQISYQNERAVSLAGLTGKQYQLPRLVEQLLEHLEKRYLELRSGKQAKQKYEYLQHLYRYQVEHPYLVDGQVVYGQIVGIDEAGKLAVQIAGAMRYFDLKEIKFLFD
ncbi:MAG: biotin--[acetyl-CoA-carboxylase] ligase [Hymenobacteraceae bacterium]|nr:biotin--[acetyl-CoA-carboxylase] ligase [Hymenobacteraceae bacterium]MDX5395360.1 biotin--[acetyl-CoA-carboxylase] ligase [Hymenobacteraceae bacterium]MDX5443267.1 biotin--[acetyl-CoA-carboxylase] ligase [Hymenobacteraceae bacterium]MDX5511411.1 biotin--[acetyl-CoA-carboxylase] ligase [Hymenobacteraceae bacterium]